MNRQRKFTAIQKMSWVLFIGFLLHHALCHAMCGPLNTPGVTNPLGDIILREGDTLRISCHLDDAYMNSSGEHQTSRSLFFERDNVRIDRNFVRIVNESTAELVIENMTASDSSFYCKMDEGTSVRAICLNKVAVGTPPQPITDFTCVSKNWESLTCTWQPVNNYVQTKYDLKYSLASKNNWQKYNCPSGMPDKLPNGRFRCFWNLQTDPHYRQAYEKLRFTLGASNMFGTNEQRFNFNHYANAIFDSPSNISTIKLTHNSAVIQWCVKSSIHIFPPGLDAKIQYQTIFHQRQYGLDYWQTIEPGKLPLSSNCYTYALKNLEYANTFYDIRVAIKSSVAKGDQWWSPYIMMTVKTLSKIPSMPPRTNVGSFEVSNGVLSRDVFIYWQQIDESKQNGDGFHYTVIGKEIGNEVIQPDFNMLPHQTTTSYAIFRNISFNRHEFKIYSSNIIGNSTHFSFVAVPSKNNMVSEPVTFTKTAIGDDLYGLSWSAPVSSRTRIVTYTVFWCHNEKDRPYQCNGELDWIEVDANMTAWNQTVRSPGIYQFAISANSFASSSGMTWASCTVINNKYVGKMKNVWIHSIGARFIEVGWKLDCSDRVGIVTGFNIYYCPYRSLTNVTCAEHEQNITIFGDLNTMGGNVTDLKPFTDYMFSVAVITYLGEGERGDIYMNRTAEAAPQAPIITKVKNVTNSSFAVEWEPPQIPNGVLRHYWLTVDRQKHQLMPNITSFTVHNLESYTQHVIDLIACTIACSPKSNNITIRTKRGYPSQMDRPAITFVNDSITTLMWRAPKVRGGPNPFYEVKYEKIYDQQIYDEVIVNVTVFKLNMVAECKATEPRVNFKWYVRAVVLDEDGAAMMGAWSEPVKRDCNVRISPIYVNVIFLLILSSVLCAIGVLMGKRLWFNWQTMKDVEVKLPPGLVPHGALTFGPYPIKDPKMSTQVNVPLSPLKQAIDVTVFNATDEQLLLERRKDYELEIDCSTLNTVTTVVSDVNSSAGSCTPSTESPSIYKVDFDKTYEKDISLRLRNIHCRPIGQQTIDNNCLSNEALIDPYITVKWQAISSSVTPSGGHCAVTPAICSTSEPAKCDETSKYVPFSYLATRPRPAQTSNVAASGYVSNVLPFVAPKPVIAPIVANCPDDESYMNLVDEEMESDDASDFEYIADVDIPSVYSGDYGAQLPLAIDVREFIDAPNKVSGLATLSDLPKQRFNFDATPIAAFSSTTNDAAPKYVSVGTLPTASIASPRSPPPLPPPQDSKYESGNYSRLGNWNDRDTTMDAAQKIQSFAQFYEQVVAPQRDIALIPTAILGSDAKNVDKSRETVDEKITDTTAFGGESSCASSVASSRSSCGSTAESCCGSSGPSSDVSIRSDRYTGSGYVSAITAAFSSGATTKLAASHNQHHGREGQHCADSRSGSHDTSHGSQESSREAGHDNSYEASRGLKHGLSHGASQATGGSSHGYVPVKYLKGD